MIPGRVSVLIPSRNERFLPETIHDVLAKAGGDVEVVAVLDGYWPSPQLPDRRELTLIHRGTSHGMREGINAAAQIATGQYLMKLDAHCLLAEGFDETLKADCESNWVVIPRRMALDAERWCIDEGRPAIDYHYLSWPLAKDKDGNVLNSMHGRWWRQRQKDRADVLIDDEMSSQGSCWFMARAHWEKGLGGELQTEGYGSFIQEFQEIGCKTWLGGGRVVVNKKLHYAHLHKGRKYGRGYVSSKRSWERGSHYSADLWMNNRWEGRVHDMAWLIDKFWPVPTWPEDWRKFDYSGLLSG